MKEWTYGWIDRMNKQMDRWMDVQKEGQIDGMDGRLVQITTCQLLSTPLNKWFHILKPQNQV